MGVRPQKTWDHRAVGSVQALSGSQDALFCQLFLQSLLGPPAVPTELGPCQGGGWLY